MLLSHDLTGPQHRSSTQQLTRLQMCATHISECTCAACMHVTSIGHGALWVCGQTLSQLLLLLFCDIQTKEGQGLRETGA